MKVFISYRHNDKPELVELITRELSNRDSVTEVFQDIFSIPPRIEFDKYIRYQIEQMDVILVIIGRAWLKSFAEKNDLGVHDFVLIEIETALRSDKLTIPVLIDGATMPSEEQLPPTIKGFARRNAIQIRTGRDLDKDIDELLSQLQNSAKLHRDITSENPGKRLLELQNENLSEIWLKAQVKIYDEVHNSVDSNTKTIPSIMHSADIERLEFDTIVYSVTDIENCKFLNEPHTKNIVENALSEVIGVKIFTRCKYHAILYSHEYENYYHEYYSLEEAIKKFEQSDQPQDIDDIPF